MPQVSIEGLRACDAQQSPPQGHPAQEAVADEEQEQVVRRQGLEDACATSVCNTDADVRMAKADGELLRNHRHVITYICNSI